MFTQWGAQMRATQLWAFNPNLWSGPPGPNPSLLLARPLTSAHFHWPNPSLLYLPGLASQLNSIGQTLGSIGEADPIACSPGLWQLKQST